MRTIMVLMLLAALPVWAGTFRDDFEDGDLNGWWQLWPNNETVWKVVDGELECIRQSQWSAELATGNVSWSDYTFEANVKILEDYGVGDLDLVVRFTNDNDGYAFLVGDWVGESSVYVQRIPDLSMKEVHPIDALEMNVWHHLKLEAKGGKFTFWVNNEKVIEYQDDMYKSGMVGFGVANHTVRFDNVVISGPGIPDVMPDTWKGQSVESRGKLIATWAGIRK